MRLIRRRDELWCPESRFYSDIAILRINHTQLPGFFEKAVGYQVLSIKINVLASVEIKYQ
jgi:hypothetical protein